MREENNGEGMARRSVIQTGATLALGGTVLTGSARAQDCDLVVDASGGGDYTTIQDAVDAANDDPAFTICVKPGTYQEKVRIGKSLTLIGDPGDSTPGVGSNAPVLEGDGDTQASGFSLVRGGSVANNVVIEGFVIQNYGQKPGAGDKWGGGIKTGASSDITVRNNEIRDIAGAGISIFNGGQYSPSGWLVERNVFKRNAAHAVHFANNVDSAVKNNVIHGGGPVPDSGSRLEQNEHEPNMGIMLANSVRDGHSAEMRNITVAGNEVRGRFDNAGILLLSINKNNVGSGTVARTRDVVFENNDVSGLGTNITNGVATRAFRLGVNPGQNDEPVDVKRVVYDGNTVGGAVTGFAAGTRAEDGLSKIVYRNNTTKDHSGNGFVIGGNGKGGISEILYENNEVESAARNGLLIRANGSCTISDVTYRGTTVRNSPRTGWRVKTREGGTVSSVVFDDSVITGVTSSDALGAGVLLRPRSSGAIRDVTITNSDLNENDIGVWAGSQVTDAFSSIVIEDSDLRDNNGAGMLLNGDASGAPFTIRNTNIVGNDKYGVKNGGDSGGVIMAEKNWWGAENGPTREVGSSDRIVGDGDRVSGPVDYKPWLTAPA